jgi:hypothetical protein
MNEFFLYIIILNFKKKNNDFCVANIRKQINFPKIKIKNKNQENVSIETSYVYFIS